MLSIVTIQLSNIGKGKAKKGISDYAPTFPVNSNLSMIQYHLYRNGIFKAAKREGEE